MELITVGDQLAKQSAGAVNLLEKLHETLEKASPEDRASLYDRVKTQVKVMTDLAEAIKAWALNTNGEISGYEVKTGTGRRVWQEDMEAEIADAVKSLKTLVSPFTLKSPAALEKELGGDLKAKEVVAKFTKVEDGALTLAAKKKK